MSASTCDKKTFDLAELLLADHPELLPRAGTLACILQEAAESWIADETAPVVAVPPEPLDMIAFADRVCGLIHGATPALAAEEEVRANV